MRWLLLAALSLFGAAGGPAHPHLEQAYAALAAGDYDTALAAFERAATREPERADIR